ncbi:hypothetical protein [Streptococcus ruminantium]|nr:hypothetical protein [Streptococcus ruminantium]
MKLPKLSPSSLAGVVTDTKEPYFLLSSEPTLQFEYKDNQRTDNIVGYKYWFIQNHTEPFQVKFSSKLNNNLKKFEAYKLLNLEAFEIDGNVYFRAESIQNFLEER